MGNVDRKLQISTIKMSPLTDRGRRCRRRCRRHRRCRRCCCCRRRRRMREIIWTQIFILK